MDSFNSDAHEEDTDGDFAADGGEAVGNFAKPPVLYSFAFVSLILSFSFLFFFFFLQRV
jgi:hypothetical protein